MRIEPSGAINDVVFVHLDAHHDDRGQLIETFRHEWFRQAPPMIQATRSDSRRGVIRALHYHVRQADYWYVSGGRLFMAMHDLRRSSPTQGTTQTVEIGEGNDVAVYVPPGVAHGFQALTDATLTYLVDHYYDPADEHGLAWDDPQAAVPWPLADPMLSDRDRANPKLADIPADRLPA